MNKRLEQLANQAYEYALAESKGGTNICAPGSDYFLAMREAKFAELIVKDVCNIVLHYTDVDEGVAVAKKHFGVEE